ncbi:hypothetical protein [Lentibacillus cibarius]|uniref:hypothetical protein n=1 Tax=Lentibacillus cibarius TaxID=2583219 RepID=UPI001F34ECB0|nr:hypothetical protein [Lentibacillus cibarius]
MGRNSFWTDLSINDRQVATLVYTRSNERIANREYQELNSTDSVTATKFTGLTFVQKHPKNIRRWLKYRQTLTLL